MFMHNLLINKCFVSCKNIAIIKIGISFKRQQMWSEINAYYKTIFSGRSIHFQCMGVFEP